MTPITTGALLLACLLSPVYGSGVDDFIRDSKANSALHEAAAKAHAIIAQLNVAEKVGLVTGYGSPDHGCIGNIRPIERVGFKGICMLDGPSGINRAHMVSAFPAGLTVAATWDRDLMRKRGIAMAEEFKGKGAHVMLGPSAGPLGRHALGGRNWEGFSPDPYLTGVAMDASISGSQSIGVQTCSKHYLGNEQETQRTNSVLKDGTGVDAVSSNIDDRTLHELYLWPFANAVKAGTSSVMCSYNRFNQTYACENAPLLKSLLRDELGFQGYVVSDWGAMHSTAKAANNGVDMEQPGASNPQFPAFFGSRLLGAVSSGAVSNDRLEEMGLSILTQYYLLGQDKDFPPVDPSLFGTLVAQETNRIMYYDPSQPETPARDVRKNHATLIREIGTAGTVLLKNEKNTLPIRSGPKSIGVFGNDAPEPLNGLTILPDELFSAATTYETGTLDIGGGSGTVRHTTLVSPLDAIKARVQKEGGTVQHLMNNTMLAAGDFRTIYPAPEVCIVFLKTFAAEGFDRSSFQNDWQADAVVSKVAAFCPGRTVVVTHSAGVNTMPWATNPNVTAILAAHLPGEQTGNSIVDVLWGDVNPSGKLPYTMPRKAEDYDIPITNLTGDAAKGNWQADFKEGQFIDYRHYDAKNIEPLYEFGFGLSYTTFALKGPLAVQAAPSAGKPAATPDKSQTIRPGGNPDLWTPLLRASVTVSNTGSVAGGTVPQLYMSFPSSAPSGTPKRVLRGFEKVVLKPGETKRVEFVLTRRDVSFWNVGTQTWQIPQGEFTFQAGFSSRKLDGSATFNVLGA